ncbi:MAG: CHAT domain-containing protein [bacterium]
MMKAALYLEITRKGESLEICLSKGEQTVVHYEECRVTDKELQHRSGELLHLLNSVSRQGKIPPVVFRELQQTGQVLYNEIFPLSIKKELADTSAEDLILRIDNRLVQVPWELIYLGHEFFCERFNIGRMVKTQQVISYGSRRDLRPPLKMLIIADPKGDLQSAYEEGNRIRESLTLKDVTITAVSSEVSADYLKKRLLQFDLVHYAGHADYDLTNPSNSGWILEDGRFTALDIRKLSGVNPMPSLVFSNACQSGTTEEWQVETSAEEKIYGLANAFLLAGVQHYIGTFWKVLDKPSTHFAIEFYGQLFAGQNVGKAMRAARHVLKERYGQENVFWASYLLYGDPTARYLDTHAVETVKRDYHFEPYPAGRLPLPNSPHSSQTYPELDCFIQEDIQGGVLWKTRSPSELMERSWRAEQQYQKDAESESHKKAGSGWPRLCYIAGVAGIIAIVSFLFPIFQARYLNNNHQSPSQGGLVTIGAKDKVLTFDWTDENSVTSFFQGFLGNYLSQHRKREVTDTWTSRPLTIFFTTGKGSEEVESATLVNKIIQRLQKHPRITILERERLSIILQELALSSTDLAHSDSALRLGELLTSTLLSTFNLHRIGSQVRVNMRLIENETSIVKDAFSEEWDSSTDLNVLAECLSSKILEAIDQHFPLKGKISAIKDYDKVILNIGARHGLKAGVKLEVMKSQQIYQNGEVISVEEIKVGEIEVDEVRSNSSFSKVLGRSEDLAVGMKVKPL